jgi:peptide subunit release factor 1 (eRF1)
MEPPARRQVDVIQRLYSSRSTMKDDENKSRAQSGKGAKDQRQERLKRALRENLKRRKSQLRERGDFTISPSGDEIETGQASEKHPGK